jgi:hypothetical protein
MKKLLLVLAALGLMAQFSACTANKAQDDAEFVENADVDKIESEEPTLDDGSEQASNDQNLSTDSSLEAALGETPADTTASTDPSLDASMDAPPPEDPPATDIAAAPTLDESSLDAPPADVAAEPPADSLAASDLPPDAGLDDPNAGLPPTDDFSAMNETPQETMAETPPPAAKTEAPIEATPTTSLADVKPTSAGGGYVGTTSLKKVSDAVPYAFGDGYVNTMYIARPKEKLKDISMTIYGADRTKELKKINSFLKARAPRAGDKIAYVSPNRPTDSARTITYYEDTGMIPETYVAQKNDNLRKVSKKLLGYDNAWKEVWSTNTIETKGKLAEGETFKYWKSTASITLPTANNNMPKTPEAAVNNIVQNNPTPDNNMMPPPQPGNDLPPPPPQADLPPAPADPMAANTAPPDDAGLESMPPPPPPDDAAFAQTAPPPPPEDKPSKAPAGDGEEVAATEGGEDMMTMLGIGVLLFGALAFVLVRRKKAQANRNGNNDIQMGEGLGT